MLPAAAFGRGPPGHDGAGQHDLRPHGADGRHPARRPLRRVGRRRQRPALCRGAPPGGPPGPVRPGAAPPAAGLPRRLLGARRRVSRVPTAVRADGGGAHPGAVWPVGRVLRRLRAAAPPGCAGVGVAAAPRGGAGPRGARAVRARQRRRPRLRLLRQGQGGQRGDAPGHDRRVGALHGGAAGRIRRRIRGRGHAGGRRGQLRGVPGDDHAQGRHHQGGDQLRPARRRRRRAAHRRGAACGWRHVQVHPLRRCHLHEVGPDDVDQRGVHGHPRQLLQRAAGRRQGHRLRACGAGGDGRQHQDQGAARERHLRHDHLPDPGEGALRGRVPQPRHRRRLHRLPRHLPRPLICRPRVHQEQVINLHSSLNFIK
uniref:Uncharacterized protein n=1 Tax=Setaria italica TaxID=4555 RepID=K3Z224_SETIT